MCDEYKASIDNNTWVLVPRPPNVNIVRSMWCTNTNITRGSLNRYKVRLVANGRSQQQGIDCDETFSPVVKPAIIRTVLRLAVSRQWPIHQLDVKNAFLHDHLTESVYMHQPPGFTDLAPSSTSLMQRIISLLHAEFAMTDLGPLNYFLGISTTRTTFGIFLSQTKYATEILEQAQMLNCNPCRTPIDTENKLGPEGSPVTDPTLYRSLVGSLQATPYAMKCVLRYLRGTTDLGLHLFRSTTSQLIAYSDADWVGCPATRRSTSGYCVFLGDNLLTWSSKRQDTSRSSAEAEYCGVANPCCIRVRKPSTTSAHQEIDIHFVRDKVAAGHVRVLHVPSRFQIFTKGLSYPLFADFRSSLSVRKTPAPIARAY
nr:ribonuclease H-like domain-containing protein [Tanacetum cinerariifolium]